MIVLECLNGCGALVSAFTIIAFFALYTLHVCFCTSLHYCCKLYAYSQTSCCTNWESNYLWLTWHCCYVKWAVLSMCFWNWYFTVSVPFFRLMSFGIEQQLCCVCNAQFFLLAPWCFDLWPYCNWTAVFYPPYWKNLRLKKEAAVRVRAEHSVDMTEKHSFAQLPLLQVRRCVDRPHVLTMFLFRQ